MLVAVGAGEDRDWGEKPPTSHNDSLVVGTRRARAREDPPMSHNDSLVAVGAGKDQGWGEKPPTRRCGWWLKRGEGGLPVSVSETIREKLMYIPQK